MEKSLIDKLSIAYLTKHSSAQSPNEFFNEYKEIREEFTKLIDEITSKREGMKINPHILKRQ